MWSMREIKVADSIADMTARIPGRRILILGLGRTGLSCARFLARLDLEVAVTDSREVPPGLAELREALPDVAVWVGAFNTEAFARADCLVVSPGVAIDDPLIAGAQARGVPVIGDIEIFARFADAPIIAITGSNGKSTVTTLLGEMARCAGRVAQVGGNIGTPALDLLQAEAPDLYILELSSFQLETTHSLRTQASALLNISEDHMDRYTGLDAYSAAKTRIFQGDGVMVLNADDQQVMQVTTALREDRQVVSFTLGAPVQHGYGLCAGADGPWLCHAGEMLLPVKSLRLQGRHNIANVLAALALGDVVGLEMPAMLEAARQFTGLPHRTQWVAEHAGVTWINDSKATNVGAAIAAIRGIPATRLILIAGGQGKGQDFTPLREALRERVVSVILLGEDAQQIAAVIKGIVPLRLVDTMEEAVSAAAAVAQPGDTVLLSPACASFDMFDGFAQRGIAFSDALRSLTA